MNVDNLPESGYNYCLFVSIPPFPVNGISSFLSLEQAKKAIAAMAVTLLLAGSFSGLFSLTAETVTAAADRAQCADGLDNDNDNFLDYPQDDDCQSLDDDFEGRGTSGVFVTVRDDKDTVAPGGAVNYVITLRQQRDAHRVLDTVTFDIPHQVTLASASDGGALSPGRVTWRNVSVHRDSTRSLTVQANINPNAREGLLIVSRVLTQGAEASDTTLVERAVQPQAEALKISLTDNREYAQPGEVLNYVIRVRNDANVSNTSNVSVELPSDLEFYSATEGYTRKTSNITWANVSFEPQQEKTFLLAAKLYERVQDRFVFRTRAYAGVANAVDQTVIRVGLPYDAISASITDNRETVEAGQELRYVVTVRNNSDVVGTNVSVDASVPRFTEIVSIGDGGKWDGSNVRWLLFPIAPKDSREVSFVIRVRPDAPLGSQLLAGVSADGSAVERDTTQVVEKSTEGVVKPVLLRKGVDRSEVSAGGRIRYTLYVRNTLDHAITDAMIVDRFDGQYMTFVTTDNPGALVKSMPGQLDWKVPALQPGQTWQASYVLEVASDIPDGTDLNNIASISGRDVSGVALSEKVRTVSTEILADFPTTGFDIASAFGLVLGAAGMASAGLHRRRFFL